MSSRSRRLRTSKSLGNGKVRDSPLRRDGDSQPVALLLVNLGVTKTHSRPRSRMSIRTPRRSSRRSSTGPISPSAQAHSSTRARTSSISSRSTTPTTGTPGSDCTRRTTCTIGSPRRGARSGPPSSRGVRRAARSLRPPPTPTGGAADDPNPSSGYRALVSTRPPGVSNSLTDYAKGRRPNGFRWTLVVQSEFRVLTPQAG